MIKCPSTYCDRDEEEEIINEWGFCAYCDKLYGEMTNEQKEEDDD